MPLIDSSVCACLPLPPCEDTGLGPGDHRAPVPLMESTDISLCVLPLFGAGGWVIYGFSDEGVLYYVGERKGRPSVVYNGSAQGSD